MPPTQSPPQVNEVFEGKKLWGQELYPELLAEGIRP